MKLCSLSPLLAVAALAMPVSAAAAQETAAASCPPPRAGTVEGSGGFRWAQTFSPSLSGRLTRAEIDTYKSGTAGNYIVQVMGVAGTGAPDNTVLASSTVPDSMPGGFFTLNAVFNTPAAVAVGKSYALVITRPGSSSVEVGYRPGCPGAFYYAIPASTDWGHNPAGPEDDMIFTAFVTPPALSATCNGIRATIVGTNGNDELTGTPGRDVMAGLRGRDRLSGSAGNDLICGDESRDTLIGGPGKDLLLGGQGHDRLLGGKGRDTCKGGGGALDRAKSCEKQKSI